MRQPLGVCSRSNRMSSKYPVFHRELKSRSRAAASYTSPGRVKIRPRTVSAGVRRLPWMAISTNTSCWAQPVEHSQNRNSTPRNGQRALQIFMIQGDEYRAEAGDAHTWPDRLLVNTGL